MTAIGNSDLTIVNEPKNNNSSDTGHGQEEEEDSDDESEILEESPCGRWVKRREQVDQRDVPGIDASYLAMDTEEGVEVVWNEILFSERKNFKAQEEKICLVFDNLTQLEHPNIVKFHKYWVEMQAEKPRVVFITEYMSSGSLKQFLKRTKKNGKKLPHAAWKRWCTQILSALSYLHSCSPSIIHGNLTCDTIFIQHNGLVKIGSVAPDAIHHHVKSCRGDNIKNLHFVAPEYGSDSPSVSSSADIFSFGMCALEMAALEIQGNGDSGTLVTEDHINKTIESLEPSDSPIHDFVRKCIQDDPLTRPTARELLFHSVLFEVPSLKLLSAHALVNSTGNISETITDEVLQRHYDPEIVVAEIARRKRGDETLPEDTSLSDPFIRFPYRMGDVPITEKLEKFVEDVKYGIYPLNCFELPMPYPIITRQLASSPELVDSVKSASPEPMDIESRRVVNMMCNVKPRDEGPGLLMTILVRMGDKNGMNRQLSCVVNETDTASELATELVYYGFIHEAITEYNLIIYHTINTSSATNEQQPQPTIFCNADRDKLGNLIEESLYNRLNGDAGISLSYPPPGGGNGVTFNGGGFYPIPTSTPSLNPGEFIIPSCS